MIRDDPSRSELIRPGPAVRVDPVRLLYLPLWKAVKNVFCIQILGGLTLGSLAIFILVLDFNSADLCYDKQLHGHWDSALPHRIQAIIVSAEVAEGYVVQMWTFLLIITMFGWPFVKKLNLLILNLLGAFLDTCYRLFLQVYGIVVKHGRGSVRSRTVACEGLDLWSIGHAHGVKHTQLLYNQLNSFIA